jgi:hypothetical protein
MADRRANATPSGAKVCVTKFTGAYLSRGSSRTSRDVPAAMMLEDIKREVAEEGAAERLFATYKSAYCCVLQRFS